MGNIRYIEIDIKDIIFLEKNPRIISSEDFEKLKKDIKEDPDFLKQRPPLINYVKGKYYCYAGTQRVRAAKEEGIVKILCFVEDNVPEKVQDRRMLKDNIHRGRWDMELLQDLDFEIFELQDFGIPVIDFNAKEFDDFFENNNSQNMEKKHKIILEYSEEEYNKVIEALSKYPDSKENTVYKLLGI